MQAPTGTNMHMVQVITKTAHSSSETVYSLRQNGHRGVRTIGQPEKMKDQRFYLKIVFSLIRHTIEMDQFGFRQVIALVGLIKLQSLEVFFQALYMVLREQAKSSKGMLLRQNYATKLPLPMTAIFQKQGVLI